MRHSPNETEPSVNTPGHYEIPQDLDVYPGTSPIKIYPPEGAEIQLVDEIVGPSVLILDRYMIPRGQGVRPGRIYFAPGTEVQWVGEPAAPEK